MGLFDKKFCDICGDKIGLLGNRKLEDGNMCKDCARKLSPFFSDRRRSTVNDIKAQLQYREQNRQLLKSFRPDRVLGTDEKFFIDSARGAFVISDRGQNNWDEENPDIIAFSAVNSCNLRIDEDREEQYYENANGESVSFNPPRYVCSYTFVLEFNVNNPYFDDFEVKLNDTDVEMNTPEYMNLQQTAMSIMSTVAPGKFTAPQINGTYGNVNPYQQQGMYQNQGMMNNFNQPAYGYPMGGNTAPVGFNQPANGYNQQPNYNQPANGYNQQPNYNQPANGYNQQPNYNQPANGYNQQMNYTQPANGYNQQMNYNQQWQNASASWNCPNCGTANTGNFCCNCGAAKNG